MAKELKKPTSYEEQIAILGQRGCMIEDERSCKEILKSINYYRLTAYFLPFKCESGNYRAGTTFQKVYRIYEFDRKLRGILFSAIEEVEVFLRSQLAYYHAHKYGADGYLHPENFSQRHNAEKFIQKVNAEIDNNKNVLFVKHHVENYDGIFPVWVITELFTFGMLSYFYDDMQMQDKKYLSEELYHTTPKNLSSWLRCCTDLRNICAHYGRLYYRIFSAMPAGVEMSDSAKRRLWGAIVVLKSLYPSREKWNAEFLPKIQALFEECKDDVCLYHLSFPEDWEKQLRK